MLLLIAAKTQTNHLLKIDPRLMSIQMSILHAMLCSQPTEYYRKAWLSLCTWQHINWNTLQS